MRNWECFRDECYYGLWAVRQVGENRWGHCFHVQTMEEAEGLRDLLNELQEKANAGGEFRRDSGVNSTALLGVPKIGSKP